MEEKNQTSPQTAQNPMPQVTPPKAVAKAVTVQKPEKPLELPSQAYKVTFIEGGSRIFKGTIGAVYASKLKAANYIGNIKSVEKVNG